MKKKGKKSVKKTVLHLSCTWCGNRFKSDRYKKYCREKCRQESNANFSKARYAELRNALLKAKGVIV